MHVLALAAVCCAVSGHVRAADGRPLDHARVRFEARAPVSATSDARGAYRAEVPAGTYRLIVVADGFASAELDDVRVGGSDTIDVVLEPLGVDRLRTIGSVSIDGRLRVARAPVPERTIVRADLDALGSDAIVDALTAVPSLTAARPNGGAAGGPVVVALRGPDPSETRISLDGQPLNDANTGDLDISRFPVAFLSGIDVSEGLGPAYAGGANTIGGEINVRTLAPTREPQSLLRLSAGSFGTTSTDLTATGMHGKFGYGAGLTRENQTGVVHDFPARVDGTPVVLGSALRSDGALGNFTYAPGARTTLALRTFTLDSVRDVSAAVNAPLDPNAASAGDSFSGIGSETRAQSVRAASLTASTVFGAGTLSASYAAASTTVAILQTAANGPYDTSYTDRSRTANVQWARSNGGSDVAIGAYVRGEALGSPDQFVAAQTQRNASVTVRAGRDAGPRLHVSASAIGSRYSTFGSSLDGRLGVTYALPGGGTLRLAAGTGFRAPLLTERFALPLGALAADANCVGANGNANLRPEHATEYEAGYGARIGATTTADATVYRTNLRDPIETFYPLGTACPAGTNAPVAQTYPVNVGNVIYQGLALALAHRAGPLFARVEYGVNAAYPTSLPAYVNNPTSGGNLVVGQQFAGIPLQTLAVALRYARGGTHAAAELTVKSANNELAQGRYAVLNAALGKRLGERIDLTVAGRNLTNAVSGRFTRLGLGVPYATPAGPAPTDALVLEPASVRVILTLH